MARDIPSLPQTLQRLVDHYGPLPGPPTSDPFELILLENVAYLAPPDRRREAFLQLKAMIGTDPYALLEASQETLERVTARGILKGTFAGKLRECAHIATATFGGELGPVTRGPLAAAKRALRSFPGIGEPGAEKILLFAGCHPFLAPESNGLRVLARLGFVVEENSYAKTYAAAREAAKVLAAEIRGLQEAHLVLHHHGHALCKRSLPKCAACPVRAGCAYARGGGPSA